MPATLAEGLHERLITASIQEALAEFERLGRPFDTKDQQIDWIDDALTRHVAARLHKALGGLPSGDEAFAARVELVRSVMAAMPDEEGDAAGETPVAGRKALLWVGPTDPGLGHPKPPPRPEHGLVHPALLFNGSQDVSLLHELEREIASADHVDAIVAFLKFSGFKLLEQGAIGRQPRTGSDRRTRAVTYCPRPCWKLPFL